MKNVFKAKEIYLDNNHRTFKGQSLAKTLQRESMRPDVPVCFDGADLRDDESQELIMCDALTGMFTFDVLLDVLNEYHQLTTPH